MRVDVEDDLENVRPGFDWSDPWETRDIERLRARASKEFFLV